MRTVYEYIETCIRVGFTTKILDHDPIHHLLRTFNKFLHYMESVIHHIYTQNVVELYRLIFFPFIECKARGYTTLKYFILNFIY